MSESENKKSTISPQEAEKRVSEAVLDVVEDDSLLIEEDGDFFWVIQRLVWGAIKTILLISVIGVIIWFIWQESGNKETPSIPSLETQEESDSTPSNSSTDTDKNSESETNKSSSWFSFFTKDKNTDEDQTSNENTEDVKTQNSQTLKNTDNQTNTNNSSQTNTQEINLPKSQQDIYEISRWAYNLEYMRVSQNNSLLEESVKWLKKAKIIGEINENFLRSQAPNIRAKKIEEVIAESEALVAQHKILSTDLNNEYQFYLNKGNQNNEMVKDLDTQITQEIIGLSPTNIKTLLEQKIIAQQQAAENLSNAKIRETLLRNMQSFATLLNQKGLPLLQPATEIRSSDR